MKKNKVKILIILVILIYTFLFIIVRHNNANKTITDYERQQRINEMIAKEKGEEIDDSEMENGSGEEGLFLEQKHLLLEVMNTDEMLAVGNKIIEGVEFINKINNYEPEKSYSENEETVRSLFNITDIEQYKYFLTKINDFKSNDYISKVIVKDIDEHENIRVELRTSSKVEEFTISIIFDNSVLNNCILTWE